MGSCHRLGLARPAEPPGYTGERRARPGTGDDRALSEAVGVTDGGRLRRKTSGRLRCRDNGKS